MQAIYIDAPFEVQRMEVRKLPLGAAILKDNRGQWLFDPSTVGIEQATALKQAHRTGRPIYALDVHMFADLQWLLSEEMKPYRKTIRTEKGVMDIPFEGMAGAAIKLAGYMPVETVEVRVYHEVPDVFSEH
jgi:hypothetical protein